MRRGASAGTSGRRASVTSTCQVNWSPSVSTVPDVVPTADSRQLKASAIFAWASSTACVNPWALSAVLMLTNWSCSRASRAMDGHRQRVTASISVNPLGS